MKAVMHNGRCGYARHNDREFDISTSDHIHSNMEDKNIYWTCYGNGILFTEAENKYYKEQYSAWIDKQNKQNIAQRHKDRCITTNDMLHNAKKCPEETVLQIGDRNKSIDLNTFTDCVKDYIKELEKYNSNIHIIDWAIHGDEATPHAHIRKVYDYIDDNGDRHISQSKALEKLGISTLDSKTKNCRQNNRKVVLDMELRERWYEICEEHGIDIDRPVLSPRPHLSKETYISTTTNQEELEIQKKIRQMNLEILEKQKIMKELEQSLQEKEQQVQTVQQALIDAEQQYKDEFGGHETRHMIRHTGVEDAIDAGVNKNKKKEHQKQQEE